jgi:hypothetical protein
MSIDQQHSPFDASLVDSTEPRLPWWMPATEPGPDWAFHSSGDFPVLQDEALIEEEESA